MIQRLNSGRRILTYPAVHPCEAIAPETLLISLIALTHSICSYKSKCIASNKRNALEAIRQIGVIRVFLEEIQAGLPGLPDSTVLSFSELHLAFQKVQYLLEDCTRDDARLWMLMNSERVANQFRVLIRTMATALDVLPLDGIHVAVEVKEQVELVMRQARRVRFQVDPEDKRVVEAVKKVLIGFEKRIDPDRSELERVLDHVGIRRWSRCEMEVRFLESEIGFENLREVGLLSSLKGLLCYCRCVMFGSVDGLPGPRPEPSNRSEVVSCLNLEDFRCPISLEIMTDPVTIRTGHSYDRSSIMKWFRAGKPICPKTGEKMKSMEVVPNLALKRLIQQYCNENGIPFGDSGRRNRDIGRSTVAGSSAAEGAMKMVAEFLCASVGTGSNKAAYEIRLLSKTSIFNRSCLVEAGVVPHLLKLLASADSEAQENAVAGLLNLSKHSKGKAVIVENGGVDLVVDVLKEGLKVEACQHAAGTLFYLASIEEYRILIGENPRAIPALRELIKNGSDRGKKNALVAIFGLLTHPANHTRVLAAGVVPLLFEILTSLDSEVLVTDSLAILATLAEKPEGAVAISRCKALDSIVGILNSSTSRAAKEFCVSLLLALCANGGHNVVALLVKSPSLMACLYSQLSEGTSRASKRASSLIKVLHEFHETRSSGPVTRVLPQERFVHVR
ncbi:putative aminoacyltransferase, E1 ubiquitin-activating enzyme [Rosa chinensis]|uniref:RING-type E3 ubiquitin transferase n=1 Tax=Rosa chinensis TaxID=74649 RepID=A0A2P6R434_ROSCH|nr:U-box domain-containing protein 19 [Rosa chinensis]PRQ41168.1 putative aminoacyltransferase, E1 ubiquitin-activating enzyme [Rosa chinensis]